MCKGNDDHQNTSVLPEKNSTDLNKWLTPITDLIKVLIWPFIFMCFLIGFWDHIDATMERVPNAIGGVKSFSFGSLKVELEKSKIVMKDPKLSKSFKGLSIEAIKTLVDIGNKKMQIVGRKIGKSNARELFIPSAERMRAVGELRRANLVQDNQDFNKVFLALLKKYVVSSKVMPDFGLSKRNMAQILILKNEFSDEDMNLLNSHRYYLSKTGLDLYELSNQLILQQK